MIKANELRVGNWVLMAHENVPELVNAKVIAFISHANSRGDNHPFEPIPLTPEILISAGFVFNEKSQSYRIFSHKEEWILAAQQTTDKTFFKIGLPVDSRSDQYMTDLIYVHQLQNLYFALAGTELEINL